MTSKLSMQLMAVRSGGKRGGDTCEAGEVVSLAVRALQAATATASAATATATGAVEGAARAGVLVAARAGHGGEQEVGVSRGLAGRGVLSEAVRVSLLLLLSTAIVATITVTVTVTVTGPARGGGRRGGKVEVVAEVHHGAGGVGAAAAMGDISTSTAPPAAPWPRRPAE